MSLTVARGATRLVILTRRRAYKLPRLLSWKHILCGLLANMQEIQLSKTGWPELCPVLWHLPGGLLVVMPRAEVCTEETFPMRTVVEEFTDKAQVMIPAEPKADSFGFVQGRFLAIDYGSPTSVLCAACSINRRAA